MAKKETKKTQKKSKVNKIRQHILQVILLSLIIFTVIFFAYQIIKLAIKPTDSILVEEGTVSKEESLTGYVIRNEQVINSTEGQGKLVQIKNEGERVSIREAVFRYEAPNETELAEQIKTLNEEIQKAMEGQTEIFSSDIKALDKQIETKISGIQGKNNIQTINEYKKDINGYITKKAQISGELSPAGSYISNLIQQRTNIEKSLYSNSTYENAPIGGIISYRVDGLEEKLTPSNFQSVTSEYLNNLNLMTGQIVSTSDTQAKIINNFECYIAIVTNTQEAQNAQVGDKIKIRLSDNQVIDAKIEHINKEQNSVVLILKINKQVESLSNYRKISLDIIWWEKEGLRVPNTSIIYENGLSYVVRTKSTVLDKILVKIVKENEDYSIVTNYTTEELKNMNYTGEQITSMKKISIYDAILLDPDLEELSKELN